MRIVNELYRLKPIAPKTDISTMENLMDELGNPQRKLRFVHVGGTNGKGSVSAMLNQILIDSGYKVGLYTSPHLFRFNERIRINNRLIPDSDLRQLYSKAIGAVRKAGLQPGFFDVTTAIALCYYAEKNVDIVVLEVGLGGRLDATNIVNADVSVITNVTLEHTDKLGNTIAKIAREKAGIVKPDTVLVTSVMKPDAITEIRKQVRKVKAVCIDSNKAVRIKRISQNLTGQAFTAKSREADYGRLRIRLAGEHQLRNAGVAITVAEQLRKKGWKISRTSLRKGLANARWPGRFEVVRKNPVIIVDSGHNEDGMRAVSKTVEALIPEKIVLVIGISDTKDHDKMLSLIAPLAKKIIVTQAKYRGTDTGILASLAGKYCRDVKQVKDAGRAVNYARKNAGRKDVILVSGSIFVIDEALRALV